MNEKDVIELLSRYYHAKMSYILERSTSIEEDGKNLRTEFNEWIDRLNIGNIVEKLKIEEDEIFDELYPE